MGSSKDAELLKEGINAEKECGTSKQVPGSTDFAKEFSSGETAISNLLGSPLGLESLTKMEIDNMPSSVTASKIPSIKLGDIVKFVGPASGGLYSDSARAHIDGVFFPKYYFGITPAGIRPEENFYSCCSFLSFVVLSIYFRPINFMLDSITSVRASRGYGGGPTPGMRGKVLLPFEDNPLSKIGVRFDKPMQDGVDFGGLCDSGRGFFCNANELRLDTSGVEDLDKLLINTMFETVFDVSQDSPFILFMKDAEKSMAGNSESYALFKTKLDKLPNNVVIIGSQTQNDNRKEKSHPGSLLFTKFGSNQTALLDLAFPVRIS
ncbi:hypothetical protein OROMI_033701 [Orobanche minor]